MEIDLRRVLRLLEEYGERRKPQLAKALPAPKQPNITPIERSAEFRRLQVEQEAMLKAQRVAALKAALETRNRFCATLAKAHVALKAEVGAGRMTAIQIAAGEALLHRLAARLPTGASR